MPVSHPHRCVFVHIPKCAGTSIEYVLGMHGNLQDIGLQPYFNQVRNEATLFGAGSQHLTAQMLRTALGAEVWATYLTFAVVRNPWDRVVSYAAWQDQKWHKGLAVAPGEVSTLVAQMAGGPDLPEALEPQHRWLEDGAGRQIVDRVLRFEHLAEDWAALAPALGAPGALPHRMRAHRDSYRRYFSEAEAEVVAGYYARDCALFDYRF